MIETNANFPSAKPQAIIREDNRPARLDKGQAQEAGIENRPLSMGGSSEMAMAIKPGLPILSHFS